MQEDKQSAYKIYVNNVYNVNSSFNINRKQGDTTFRPNVSLTDVYKYI